MGTSTSDRFPLHTWSRFCPRWTTAEEANPSFRTQPTNTHNFRCRQDERRKDEQSRGRNRRKPSNNGWGSRWTALLGTGRSHGGVVESAKAFCTLHASAMATKKGEASGLHFVGHLTWKQQVCLGWGKGHGWKTEESARSKHQE